LRRRRKSIKSDFYGERRRAQSIKGAERRQEEAGRRNLQTQARCTSLFCSSLARFNPACRCDERIFHKIYLTRSEIISALLSDAEASRSLKKCGMRGLNEPTSRFDSGSWSGRVEEEPKIKKIIFWEILRRQMARYCWNPFASSLRQINLNLTVP
jgi:hypothetical protein